MKRETEIACARWDERIRTLEAVGKLARNIMDNPEHYGSSHVPPADPRTAAIIASACSGYVSGDGRNDGRLELSQDFPPFSMADMDRYLARRAAALSRD